MLFLKDLNFLHLDAKEIPCITSPSAPDENTPGAPGVLYMDTDSGCLYKCTAANTWQEEYTWQPVGDVDANTLQRAVTEYLAAHPVSGGITSAAVALLITILQNAVFTTNQTSNIAALRQALASGGGEAPDIPDTPDEPVVTDDITVSDSTVTIVSVGSEITVSGGIMTIA